MHAMLSNDYKRKVSCMAAGAPAAFCRTSRRGFASPQSAHSSSLTDGGNGVKINLFATLSFLKVLLTKTCGSEFGGQLSRHLTAQRKIAI